MTQPNNRKNEVARMEERRQRVATLYLEGKTQAEIAKVVGTTQATVSNDLAGIRDLWLAHAIVNFDERAARELARLDHLEAVAWAAYRRSAQPAISSRKKGEQRRERPGDCRFLEQVCRCIELRMKTLGMLKNTSVVQQVAIQRIDWDELLDPPARTPADDIEARIAAVGQPLSLPSPYPPTTGDDSNGTSQDATGNGTGGGAGR